MVGLGHEVHLLCQDRDARALPWVDAVGTWEDGELRVEILREPVRCTVYTPPIGRVLPVYVADRYEGFDAKPFQDLTDAELDHYIAANVGAVRDVADRARPDAALANHLVMGPVVLARAGLGYAVKIHGSALEYTVKPHPDRFLPLAREGLDGAAGVLVGSRHTAESLWAALDDAGAAGADPPRAAGGGRAHVSAARPRGRRRRAASARGQARGRSGGGVGRRHGRRRRAARARSRARPDRLVRRKADRVEGRGPAARGLAARGRRGSGRPALRGGLRRVPRRPGAAPVRDRAARPRRRCARSPVAAVRSRAGSETSSWYLAVFLDGLADDERERWLAAAPAAAARVHFTGRLEHSDLPDLLPACEAQVVPSTFPEAFGMVAIEAAACGALPLSASHSGLAEVTAVLREGVDEDLRPLLEFERGPNAVHEIAEKLVGWLTLEQAAAGNRGGGALGAGARALWLGERGRGGDCRQPR